VNNYSNANVSAYLASNSNVTITTTSDISASNISSLGLTTINNLYSPNFYANAVTYANATGYLTSTNLFKYNPGTEVLTVGSISTTGNVTGNYILGNGSQLTGITTTYGNSNVVANLAALGSNPISTAGNITGNYFIGNGSQLTGITTTYGNSNVANYLTAYTGNLTANNISVAGNINGILGNGNSSISIAQNGNITLNVGPFATTHLTVDQYGISVFGNITTAANVTANNISAATIIPTGNTLIVKPLLGDSTGNLVGAGFVAVYYNPTTGEFAYASS
jgi:hypothetical protein